MAVDRDEPCYVISAAAKLLDMHPQTLRYYERLGFVAPAVATAAFGSIRRVTLSVSAGSSAW